MISYLVRITVHHPREDDPKWKAPTNTDIEYLVVNAIMGELKGTLPIEKTAGISVTVSSERLDV